MLLKGGVGGIQMAFCAVSVANKQKGFPPTNTKIKSFQQLFNFNASINIKFNLLFKIIVIYNDKYYSSLVYKV